MDWTWSIERGCQGLPVVPAGRATSKELLVWLKKRFSGRMISCKCDPQWSLYSPDLNPQIFISGDILKTGSMFTIPKVFLTWKELAKTTIKAIPREECKKIIDNFVCRVQVYLQCHRAYFEDIFLSSNKSKVFQSIDFIFCSFFRTRPITYVCEIL